jgi:hypothetical protein
VHRWIVREVLPEPLDVRELALEVEFASDHSRELVYDGDRVVRLQLVDVALRQVREVAQDAQVGFDPRLDAVLLYFQNDALTGVQARGVHLRDRSRRKGHGVEFGEQLTGRFSQLSGDRRLGASQRIGRRAALQQ